MNITKAALTFSNFAFLTGNLQSVIYTIAQWGHFSKSSWSNLS